MDVSRERPQETARRLLSVIRKAKLQVYASPYRFKECGLAELEGKLDPEALAVVRDDEVWSQLVPAEARADGAVALVRFHFPAGLDNSGFVGWLASHIKRATGSGVLVVCGQNSGRGGIFDYWGFPLAVKDQVIGEIEALMSTPAADRAGATIPRPARRRGRPR